MRVPAHITNELKRRGYKTLEGERWRGRNGWLATYVQKGRYYFLATVSFHTAGAILEILRRKELVQFSAGKVLPELPA